MNLKKYISVGICAILVLASALVGVESNDVKVKKRGTAAEVTDLQSLGEVLGSFADSEVKCTPYWNLVPLSEKSGNVLEEKYKSATLHIEIAKYSSSGRNGASGSSYVWEQSSFYIGEEARYYTFNGVYTETGNASGEDLRYQTYYTTEFYFDEEVSLVRISDYFRGEYTVLEDGKTQEKTATLAGLKLDKWYYLADLEQNGYSSYYSMGYQELSVLGALILSGKDQFEYLDKEDGLNMGALRGGIYQLKDEDEDYGYELSKKVIVDFNEEKKPEVIFQYNSYKFGDITTNQECQMTVTLENVNATEVKPLKKAKIEAVDVSALQNEEVE